MKREDIIERLIAFLLDAIPEYKAEAAMIPMDIPSRRYLLRCLMNVWDPHRTLPAAYFRSSRHS